jgi:hypothetical protein
MVELNYSYLMATLFSIAVAAGISAWIAINKIWQSLAPRREWKPILNDKIYPPQTPLEIDQTKRDKILKRRNVK